MIEKPDDIVDFVRLEFKDESLPLSGQDGVVVNDKWKITSWQLFETTQWRFLTPFFARQHGTLHHYELNMAYDELGIIENLADDSTEIKDYVSTENKEQEILRNEPRGGQGSVRKVKLHHMNYNFGQFKVSFWNS